MAYKRKTIQFSRKKNEGYEMKLDLQPQADWKEINVNIFNEFVFKFSANLPFQQNR